MDTYSPEAMRERVAVRARHRYFAELVRTNPDVATALADARKTMKKEKTRYVVNSR